MTCARMVGCARFWLDGVWMAYSTNMQRSIAEKSCEKRTLDFEEFCCCMEELGEILVRPEMLNGLLRATSEKRHRHFLSSDDLYQNIVYELARIEQI